jgi:CTP-dependent riboflavin kinase
MYNRNVIEIMASFNIRDRFYFSDDDEIEVEVPK